MARQPKKEGETAPESGAKKARRKPVSKEVKGAAWRACGGKCWVTGEALDPFGDFVAMEGKAVAADVAGRAGGLDGGLEGLRLNLAGALRAARVTMRRFGKLQPEGERVVFAGEQAEQEEQADGMEQEDVETVAAEPG